MHATRDTWRSKHRLVRQLNTLRKRYESRLPSRGFSLLDHADQATVLVAFPDVDPYCCRLSIVSAAFEADSATALGRARGCRDEL